MTDKNRPAPAVDAAPPVVRALTVAISKVGDCSETCTSDRAVCLPKDATDTFVNDLRSALDRAGFKVADAQGSRADVPLEVCVRPTSGQEKTTSWQETGRSANDIWDPANGEFGKDPDGYLYEVGTAMCPTGGRKIVIGQQKREGYDSGAAAAAVANRLSACETLIALAQGKSGAPTATAAAAPGDSTPAPTATAARPSGGAGVSGAPCARDLDCSGDLVCEDRKCTTARAPGTAAPAAGAPQDEDVVELTDGTRVRGRITKEEAGKVVMVTLADGRSETIAWGAVVRITHRTEDDVVHLKDGTFARGKVLKEEPGKAVVIKRADGATTTIPWDQVIRVVRGKK